MGNTLPLAPHKLLIDENESNKLCRQVHHRQRKHCISRNGVEEIALPHLPEKWVVGFLYAFFILTAARRKLTCC